MKNILFCLLLLFNVPICSFSQITNGSFFQQEIIDCPFNPEVSVQWPKGWSVYQTQNDQWDGPVDSSRCFTGFPFSLSLEQMDPDKAIFIRQSLTGEEGFTLLPDYVYSIEAGLEIAPSDTLNLAENCPNDLCSGLIIVVDIPDESGSGINSRFHRSSFQQETGNTWAESCLVTEYFPENILREIILKISYKRPPISNRLGLSSVFADSPFFGVNQVEELVFPESTFSGESYQGNIAQVARPGGNSSSAPYIFLHRREVYPKPDNLTYIEARPEVAIGQAAELRASIDEYQSALFQPYTAIRGALVHPDDTLRNRFTLVNDGGEFCFPFIIELVVLDGAEVEFRSGHIDFSGPNSCIMFRDGGVLVIPDNTQFTYGTKGRGALGLDKGGTIKIGQGSELIVNNTLILANFKAGWDRQVYLELNPESRLTFGKQGRLVRKGHVQNGQMLLNVYMNGGILDDSQLSPKERSLINRIYPKNKLTDDKWLLIRGNPARNHLNISIQARQAHNHMGWTINSLSGQLIKQGRYRIEKGQNELSLDVRELAGGMYMLTIDFSDKRSVRKFIKI